MKFEIHELQFSNDLSTWSSTFAKKQAGEWPRHRIEKAISSPGTSVDGGFANGVLVAIIVYRTFAGILEVDFLGTSIEHRRRGFMSRLLREVCGQCSVEAVWLEVHKNNLAARYFYQNMGFIKTGERSNYYQDGAPAELWTWNNPLNSIA